MIKKITFFTLSLLLTAGLWAQVGNNDLHRHNTGGAKTITFSASDIQFWTGTGTNQAIIILDWDDDPNNNNIALAWGVHWNGSATATDLLDTIVAYDSRFSYTLSGSLMTNMSYNDGTINPGSSMGGWCYYINGDWGMYAWPNMPMTNGDVLEMSSSCMWTMTSAVAATNPNLTAPEDATIDASDITYWIGEGPFDIIFTVNWPDTALAWGYHFSARSTNLQSVMNDIAAEDPRLVFEFGSYGIDDILFIENGDTLRKGASSWWEHSLNGSMSSGLSQQLNDGDFSRWADPTAGVLADSTYDSVWNYWMYTYAYPQTIYPVSAPTPTDATINAADLVYWVGEGSNELTFVVNWADTALAWGYRFANDSVTLATVMDDIATADPRFSYSGEGMVNDIYFVEHGDTLRITPGNWWSHLLNGTTSAGMGQWMHNGDFSRWADPAAGVVVDSIYHSDWNWWEYIYAYTQTIHPVSNPAPQSATISADDIRYWVGEGENQLIFVVNWPGTALAWGYRFDGNATVQDAMDAIAADDSRFSYETGDWGVDDILFVENGDTLHKAAYSWWEHTMNGVMSAGMYQQLSDGDFSRWADPTAGVAVDSTYDSDWNYWMYSYAYPQAITPVSNPDNPEVGPFCGAVGTEGCTAVKFDDSRIKGWATTCTVVRGSSNLLDPDAAPVTYGTDQDAVGAATSSTMDVVSLGDGGSATLTFATPIVNGEGYDFAVFENSFNDSFLELAVVEVSSDGEHFVRFPATSLTQTDYQITDNNGGVDPTFINNLAGKYRVGYGTPFDLDELRDSANIDINNITHVRVIDVVGSIDPQYGTRDAFGHMINDPFPTITHSSGFDLDGVAVLNDMLSINEVQASALKLYPNPANNSTTISFEVQAQRTTAFLYDMTGRTVATFAIEAGTNTLNINTATLTNGIYMLHMAGNIEKLVIRH
jgi:hypothetical protein